VRVSGIGARLTALTALTAAGALLFGGVAFAHDGDSGHHGESSAHCKQHLGLSMLGEPTHQCEGDVRGYGNARGSDGADGGDGPHGAAGEAGDDDTNDSTAGRND